jgi:hypothetical protein
MRRALIALILGLTVCSPAVAQEGPLRVPTTCLPTPLPSQPVAPVYAFTVVRVLAHVGLEFWRQACADGSGQTALLVRATPILGQAVLCGSSLRIEQAGRPYGVVLYERLTDSFTFCTSVQEPVTLAVQEDFAVPSLDVLQSFTVVHLPSTRMDIPAGAPAPPPAPQATVTITLSGCRVCSPGQFFRADATIQNGGVAATVELKLGARLPGTIPVSLLNNPHTELTLAPDEIRPIPLFAGPFPSGVPVGEYAIEGALLEPELGETIHRHSVPFQVTAP